MYNNNARFKTYNYGVYGEVVNTADCGSAMRRFDPCYTPQTKTKGLRISLDLLLFFIGKAINIIRLTIYYTS